MKAIHKKFNAAGKSKKERERAMIEWIKSHGIESKAAFSKRFPGEKYPRAKFKWLHVWNPGLKKGNWTDLEDLRLFASFERQGGSWALVAADLENRSRIAIRNRFVNSFKSKTLKPAKDAFKTLIFRKKIGDFGKSIFIISEFRFRF